MAEKVDTTQSMPLIASRQQHLSNIASHMTTTIITFLNHICTYLYLYLAEKFSTLSVTVSSLVHVHLSLVPSRMHSNKSAAMMGLKLIKNPHGLLNTLQVGFGFMSNKHMVVPSYLL